MEEGLCPSGEEIAQREEIAERLRHLLAVHDQVLGVQPEAHEGFAGGGSACGDFVFVVREGQVDAAGVDVQRFAEIFHGHGGALDVPAGTAGADARLPEMFAGFGRFPESEIAGVVFFVAIVYPRARRLSCRRDRFWRACRNPEIWRCGSRSSRRWR